jgi:hypothetical protein
MSFFWVFQGRGWLGWCMLLIYDYGFVLLVPHQQGKPLELIQSMCTQRIKSRYNTFMIILLLRSVFIIIDTIVFDLADTQSAIGLYLVLLIQKCFDALLLVYIVLLTKSVRTLGGPRAAQSIPALAPASTAQTQAVMPANNPPFMAPAYAYPLSQSPHQPTIAASSNAPCTGRAIPTAFVPGTYPGYGQGHHPFPTSLSRN